jgi:AcrR family transcriptional regulator
LVSEPAASDKKESFLCWRSAWRLVASWRPIFALDFTKRNEYSFSAGMGPAAKKKWVEHVVDPQKRAAILDAALELFAERGFHGTAVPLIAEKARVGAGTLYRYFASKESLVNVLYRQWKGKLTGAVLKDFPLDAHAREQFGLFWRRITSFALEHPAGFAFLELQHHAPYLDAESRDLEEQSLQLIRGFVARAQSIGQMKAGTTPELIMAIVYGAAVGLLKGCHHGHLTLDEDTVSRGESLMWEAVKA